MAVMKHFRRNRQEDIFKKLKRLSGSKARPVHTIVDEAGQPLQESCHWQRHLEQVLNVKNAVTADVLAKWWKLKCTQTL